MCSWSGKTVYLLHVLGDGVLLQELCALACVETFRVGEELTLKVLLVHRQRGAFGEGVLLVQTQLDCRGRRGETREEIFMMLQLVTDFIHRTTRWTVSRMFDLSSNFIFNVYWYSFHEHQNKQWWNTFGQVRHHLITLYTWTDFFLQFLQMFNMKLNLPTWFSGWSGDYLPKIKSDINDWLLLLLLPSTVK